ncbi:hypothetical protein K227x_08210 [Rubripirellula lacrimiformis]|uniref:Uncharacterized protein n=1 Tax=Rubripirellula lacrimiformis TaxID=1930273 RepID=A0A517N5P0_9BACT|nr:cold shock domain-containing protein [Rubripirellula lacrimiformis]QDT02444.1 hypothetical protein K227x_08210 [Rubripirellula lacrimiformis]
MPRHDDEDTPPAKKFRIQRRRLGKIIQMRPDGSFGFIEAEDYREDVFFHKDVWDGRVQRHGREVRLLPEEGMWVEFELDEVKFEVEKRLRALVVRPTNRPIGRKLSGRDATFKIIMHHPNAKRKRPTWRNKE